MQIPECVKSLPVISIREAFSRLCKGEHVYTGFSVSQDWYRAAISVTEHNALNSEASFSGLTVAAAIKKYGKGARGYSINEIGADARWISQILATEIEMMLKWEEENGPTLLFLLNKDAEESKWYDDHVFTGQMDNRGDVKTRFSFTVWELRHLLPLFPKSVVLVDPTI
jgi:hypothetical protein